MLDVRFERAGHEKRGFMRGRYRSDEIEDGKDA
jgi:hypothetical protein